MLRAIAKTFIAGSFVTCLKDWWVRTKFRKLYSKNKAVDQSRQNTIDEVNLNLLYVQYIL